MIINLSNKNITKLDLSNQNLKVFPKEIFELKNLRKLNLSNNQIKEIPKEIENLKLLNTLDLSNNKISGLYSNFFNLKFLKILNSLFLKSQTIPLLEFARLVDILKFAYNPFSQGFPKGASVYK